jgi:hypothetical protein
MFDGLGHLVTGIEYEGVGTGKGGFHQLESVVVHMAGEIGKVAQVGADKGKPGFFRFDPLDPGHPFHCPGFGDIASYAVNSIGGIDDHSAITKQVNYLLDHLLIRVLFVEFQQHRFQINRVKIV